MMNLLSLFRVNRERKLKAKPARMTPSTETLETRSLLNGSKLGQIVANWSGIFNNPANLVGPISGLGSSSVSFGSPATTEGQNTLTFSGARFPTPLRVLNHTANTGVAVGVLSFRNTPLTAVPLSGINLSVTIGASIGSRTINLPLRVNETPNAGGGSDDTITLVGKPIIRLLKGYAVQILGFGSQSSVSGRVVLSNHLTVAESTTGTVAIVGKLIRI